MKIWASLKPIFLFFLTEQRNVLLAGAACAAATVLAGLALLGLSGWFITATAIAGLSIVAALAFDVFMPAAGIRLLALSRTAARYGERLVTHEATFRVLAAMRQKLFLGWAAPDAARQLSKRPSKLLFRLTGDIDALDSLYLRILVPLAAALCAALVSGVVLGLMNPLFGLSIGLLIILAGLGIPVVAANAARKPARRRAAALEALRSRTIDLAAGQADLLMVGRLDAQREKLALADTRLAQADDALNRIEARVTFGFGVASAIVLSGALIGVAMLAEAGTIGAPVAALGLLVALTALEPFAALRRGAVELGRTVLAANRLSPRLVSTSKKPARPLPFNNAVELSAVDMRYADHAHAALHAVTLSIAEGEHVALVGSSGSGKSTLLGLISGELTAESGSLRALDATLLTQRTELFRDSVRENLRLADASASDDALWSALADAGLANDVRNMPKGLDTLLGEGGTGLSSGQARRLALARLLLKNSPVWLLDEPTEGVDGRTADDVLARLSRNAAGRTIVIATHVEREAAICDRVVVLDRGRIVETAIKGSAEFGKILARLRQR